MFDIFKRKIKTLLILLLLIILIFPIVFLSADNPYTISLELYSNIKEVRLDVLNRLRGIPYFWAIERMIQILLTDDDDDMRITSCEILAGKIDPRAIQSFTYTINDPNLFVRLCSVKALSKFINDYPIETLIERLSIEDNDIYGVNKDYYEINLTSNYNVRKEIIKTLCIITDYRKKPLLREKIIAIFKKQYDIEEDWGVRIEILESILRLKRSEGIEFLKYALSTENELYVLNYSETKLREIKMGAFADKILLERDMLRNKITFDKSLTTLSKEDLEKHIKTNKKQYLIDLLYHSDYRKRLYAVNKLGMIASGEIVDIIEYALLNDESRDVRWACILQLAKCGDEDSVKVLIEAFYDTKNSNLKMEIIRALSKLGVNRSEY